MDKPLILVTNDDGVNARGIQALAKALEHLGRIVVFAPDRQRSAVGHGVSLHSPLRVTQVREDWHMVDGTPADCVILAVRGLLETRPSLVVSGINAGANLGDDVTYSGTVAGAYEGMLLGIPSFAISNIHHAPAHYDTAGHVAALVASHILTTGLQDGIMLNVNLPDLPLDKLAGITYTCMGKRNYQDELVIRKDPRGSTYYWLGGAKPDHYVTHESDFEAIEEDKVTITPLQRDITAYAYLEQCRQRPLKLGY